MAKAQKVEFKFDERSLVSIEKMKKQGVQFHEIVMAEGRVVLIPVLSSVPLW